MKKIFVLGLFLVLALSVIAIAVRPEFVSASVAPSGGNAKVTIPARAVEVAPGVFDLGTAVHGGNTVQGYAFVHFKEAPGKPSGCNNDGVCQGWEDPSCGDCDGGGDPDTSSCYGFLSKGAMWKSVEPYVVNPANSEGLDETLLVDNFALDVVKWEDAAGVEIVGSGSVTSTPLVADEVQPDGLNEVYFGDVDYENAIGITIVWGTFNAPPPKRELVEWDMVFDDADFDWSMDGDPLKMDFENIATHELGHTVGMNDLYNTDCSEATMYGFATEGETKKSTLEAGDIAGVQKLYG